jgi:hypothetical protein
MTARDGTQSIDETFDIKVVDGSQFLLSEITNANISVRENFDITLPLYGRFTLIIGGISKGNNNDTLWTDS